MIILFISISLLIWILIVPFTITIDSAKSLYELTLGKSIRANIFFTEEHLLVRIKVWFYNKDLVFPWIKLMSSKSNTKEIDMKKPKTKRRLKIWDSGQKIKKVMRSFEIRKLWVNLDTGDSYYNSILYPIFFFAKGSNYRLNINYLGENEFSLIARNRLSKILLAFNS